MKKGKTALLACSLVLLMLAVVANVLRTSTQQAQQGLYRSSLPPYNPYDSIRTNTADYLWPTNASRAITSTFGEFRRTHFHAGIDISTHDRTGYPVYATRDGYVLRISVSPDGYGKMLEIRHNDGYSSLYAHLDRFAGSIAERARLEQKKAERFAVEVRCNPRDLPVRKGDVIAYTGETGSGSAHLHFEIRDENSNGINPFLCKDFTVLDNIPPTIRAVAFIPLEADASVNGSTAPRVYSVRTGGPGTYELREPVSIAGAVGVAVSARDRSDETWFRHGVYDYRLSLDDSLLFESRIDRVPVEQAKQIGIYYHWDLLAQRKGRFEKLYVDSPNSLPFLFPDRVGAGCISGGTIPGGPHRLSILASDRNGNTARLSARVIVKEPPHLEASLRGDSIVVHLAEPSTVTRLTCTVHSTQDGAPHRQVFQHPGGFSGERFAFLPDRSGTSIITAENAYGAVSTPVILFSRRPTHSSGQLFLRATCEGDFIRIRLTTVGMFTSAPALSVSKDARTRALELTPVDVDTYSASYVPDAAFSGVLTFQARAEFGGVEKSASCELEVYPLVPGREGSFSIDSGRLTLEYNTTSTFKPLLVRVTRLGGDRGPDYLLEPSHTILRSGIRVLVRSESPLTDKDALYQIQNSGRVRLPDQKTLGGDVLSGSLPRTLGQIALMRDSLPPVVRALRVSAQRRVSFSFGYDDDLSGVDYERFKTYLDGTAVIPEIDGEHHRAFYRSGEQLQRGPHELIIRISDNQGNGATVERRFVVN